MLPHTAILSLPPTQKQRRRTLHLTPLPRAHAKLWISPYQVHIRELTIDQAGLGCAIWDGAVILARFIHHHLDAYFRDASVLELGAGVGLPGIVAARVARQVLLSDYLEVLADNVQYNIKLNSNPDDGDLDELPDVPEDVLATVRAYKINTQRAAQPCMLDWHDVPDVQAYRRTEAGAGAAAETTTTTATTLIPSSNTSDTNDNSNDNMHTSTTVKTLRDPLGCGAESMDVVIGAEIMYTPSVRHRVSLARTLHFYLRPGGRFFCVQSMNREGMRDFLRILVDSRYEVQVVEVQLDGPADSWMTHVEEKRKGFAQRRERYLFYTITKPPADANAVLQLPSEDEIARLERVEKGEEANVDDQHGQQQEQQQHREPSASTAATPAAAAASSSVDSIIPDVQYALDEQAIRAHATSSLDPSTLASILTSVTSEHVLTAAAHEQSRPTKREPDQPRELQ